jgi:hypothetical protein
VVMVSQPCSNGWVKGGKLGKGRELLLKGKATKSEKKVLTRSLGDLG